MGRTGQDPDSMTAAVPRGNTRGRFSVMPPPVMCASAERHCASINLFNAGSVSAIRDNDRDARVGDAACVDVVGDGDEVGTASGEEDTEDLHAETILILRRSEVRGQIAEVKPVAGVIVRG